MSRSATQRTSRRPYARRRSASTSDGGGAFSTLAFIPVAAAALSCLFTIALTGQTTSPMMLRQEMERRAEAQQEDPAVETLAPETGPPTETDAPEETPGRGRLSRAFTREVLYWEARILEWAAEWGLDPNLAATVMQIESCGDPLARSRSGAMGLFQVMPYHFAAGEQPYDPATNALRGLAYLHESLETHLTTRLALAGYNGGIRTASRAEYTWPAETVRYAYWGSGIYQEASDGVKASPTLEEWLNAGGASLCAQAAERLGLDP
ncbi:MAG: transglycosylase SLT domain-containing protein [Chloroflexi bacterium]|nr:transglycosylase SLT domain-containing protein [Chloroflexota bacterium]